MNEKILNLNERTPTWENIGVDVTNARSLESVMAKAGLNYEVEKKPIEIQGTGLILPDKVATVRTYDNHPMASYLTSTVSFRTVKHLTS